MALGQLRSAVKGRTEAAREITDRLEGKACQQVEISGREGGAIDLAERVAEFRKRVNKKLGD